jgi:hypothetical protein
MEGKNKWRKRKTHTHPRALLSGFSDKREDG